MIISKLLILSLLPNTAYYVSFGPHSPCEPGHKEGNSLKITLGVVGMLGILGLLYAGICLLGRCLLLELEILLLLCHGP